VLEYPAVQLFVERAAMARPGFRLRSREEAEAVAQVCQHRDGRPLAIELAAARMEMLTGGQIAARLSDRFRLLTGGGHGVLPRHQTLRALIDWSYGLLTEEERALLRRLSVFAGGWTLEAAEAVFRAIPQSEETARCSIVGDPSTEHRTLNTDALDVLASLINKSLVLADESDTGVRYRMLETVREYAREKLQEEGHEESARQQHFAWFLQLAERARQDLYGPAQETVLARWDAELDNMRVALDFARTSASLLDGHLHLSSTLWPFWLLRGLLAEGREHLFFALQHTGDAPPPIRAQSLLGLATLANAQWDAPTARANAEECLALYGAMDDPKGIADALLCLGYAAYINAEHVNFDYAEAQQFLDEGIEICRRIGYQHGLVGALGRLGFLLMGLKHFEAARPILQECLSASQALGAESSTAESLYNLGRLARCDGDFDTALGLLEQSLSISRRLGHLDSISAALLDIALVAVEQGDLKRAREPLDEFVEIWRRLGNPVRAAWGLVLIGNIAYCQADYGAARPWYLESQKIFRECENLVGIACAGNSLGSVAFHQADSEGAREFHKEALAIYFDLELADGMTWSLERLGIVEATYGEAPQAACLLGAASVMREGLGRPLAPWDEKDLDNALDAARATLSEAVFAQEFQAGRSLSRERAIRMALSDQ
jgi:tetratricopeptide (TPR) repeat protein